MSKFTFIYEHESMFNDSSATKLTMESNVVSLDDVLEQFEMFLKGAGFEIGGKLDIVYDNDVPQYDENEEEAFDDSQMSEINLWPDDPKVSWPFEAKVWEK